MTFDPASLRQAWPAPSRPRPIVTIGAGSIVADAHFPAYGKAGFPVAGVFDLDAARAKGVAEQIRRAGLRLARRGAGGRGRDLRSRDAARPRIARCSSACRPARAS